MWEIHQKKEIVFWEICSNFWKIKIGLYIFHWIIYNITSYITYDSYIWIWYIHIWHTYHIYEVYLSHIYHTYYLSTYDIYERHQWKPTVSQGIKNYMWQDHNLFSRVNWWPRTCQCQWIGGAASRAMLRSLHGKERKLWLLSSGIFAIECSQHSISTLNHSPERNRSWISHMFNYKAY